MKLRTLSFNKTLLRKDIFRFAPLWAIYLIGGLLVMLPNISVESGPQAAYELSSTMGPFAIINMIYAVLAAQMLFGDLYKSRLCNALHALPMRRETWFATHVVAGLAYSVVPHFIGAIFFMPMLGQYSWVALTWVAVMLMEYLFFFGLAVFCVMCTGNRFAQVAVYAIINFLSLIVYWFVSVIYQPQLYGVQISEDIFALTCPALQMASNTQLLKFEWVMEMTSLGIVKSDGGWVYMGPGEGWGYLGICTGIGVALFAAALLLYRRRKLECAGEFLAIERLKPVFAVVFALCAGGVVSAFGQSTGLADSYLLFLIIGLVVGWFGGQMLLQRSVRVFRGKSFAHLAILGLALVLTVGLTAWDPVGITRYVPEAENVKAVEFTQGRFYSYSNVDIEAEDAENIQRIQKIHQAILQERGRHTGNYRTVSIRYTLKSGRQVTREYPVYTSGAAWDEIQELYHQPENILGETEWVNWYNSVRTVYFNSHEIEDIVQDYNTIKKEELEVPLSAHTMKTELLMAVFEDARAENLISYQVHDKEYCKFYVSIERTNSNGYQEWLELYIPTEAEHCQQWMKKYAEPLMVYGFY
jgi:ABC-2 type transport system permease protein